MDFYGVVDQVIELLRRHKRVSYRGLERQFGLDASSLADLKEELIEVQELAADKDGRMLVLAEEGEASRESGAEAARPPAPRILEADAENRLLTVMFCDLVDSTVLSQQLDPEELREIVRAYQRTCCEVIERFEGHVAQYLGDGLLVYFGYPKAYGNDAERAIRASLGILEAMAELNLRLDQEAGLTLAVRLGLHSGRVVVGEMGGAGRQERLALGDTPNIAARLQGLAEPDAVVVSSLTHQLGGAGFACEDIGVHQLKGLSAPMKAFRVLEAKGRQDDHMTVGDTVARQVGRDAELAYLVDFWERSKKGRGQTVLVRGEAGIGKSHLVKGVRQRVVKDGGTRILFFCSPYYRDSAFYPVIDSLERWFRFRLEDSPEEKLGRLRASLEEAGLPVDELAPALAALLSLPLPEGHEVAAMSPQVQRRKILEVLVETLLALSRQNAVLTVWEDLHLADPSTLELLGRIIDRTPDSQLCNLLTCRPEFEAPWGDGAKLSHLPVRRFKPFQVREMVAGLVGGREFPAELVEQVIAKTDGVPLFVHEVVIMILESGLVREEEDRFVLAGPLPALAIPPTLQESLMARLDRLAESRELVQLGAVVGREFIYQVILAAAEIDEVLLQGGLQRLVDDQLLLQRGRPPQSHYYFKHALIRDIAYQSLLKSTRQRYHRRIFEVLEKLPESMQAPSEILAHHATESGLTERAVGLWLEAGEQALRRSANVEAVHHLERGRELLTRLSATEERDRLELRFLLASGAALTVTRGWAAPESEEVYRRVRELRGSAPAPADGTGRLDAFTVLLALHRFHALRGELCEAHRVGGELLSLSEGSDDPALLLPAHVAHGYNSLFRGELAAAREHLQQGMRCYDPGSHDFWVSRWGEDLGIVSLGFESLTSWLLGFPDQAVEVSRKEIGMAEETGHPFSMAFSLWVAARLHVVLRRPEAVLEKVEQLKALSLEQEFRAWLGHVMILNGWAVVMSGGDGGVEEILEGLEAEKQGGALLHRTYYLSLLADVYRHTGRDDEALDAAGQGLELSRETGEGYALADLHRHKGMALAGLGQEEPAEAALREALAVACRQEARSLELRAAMGLGHLEWRRGRRDEARRLVEGVFGAFTEGFDTADLRDAKALLDKGV